jgi:hypothetical protein
MSVRNVAPRKKSRRRELRQQGVMLRTEDRDVDLNVEWPYRQQMLELCSQHRVMVVNLRSDSFRAFAGICAITCNPPPRQNDSGSLPMSALTSDCGIQASGCHGTGWNTKPDDTRSPICGRRALIRRKSNFVKGPCMWRPSSAMAIARGITRFDAESWHYARLDLLYVNRRSEFDGFTPALVDQSTENGFRELMQSTCKDEYTLKGLLM